MSDLVIPEVIDDSEAEVIIDEVFIMGDDSLVTREDLREMWAGAASKRTSIEREDRGLVFKAYEGSTTNTNDIGQLSLGGGVLQTAEEVEPPYDPVILRTFLEIDALHYRAVKAKVADSVGRSLKFVSNTTILPDDSSEEVRGSIRQEDFDKELEKIKEFSKGCNDIIGLDGVLEKAATDYEAVGYCAVEVIRSLDRVVRKVNHIPAERIRVLKGWKGFTEVVDGSGKKVYYQNFGEKVVSTNRTDLISGRPASYDPTLDGEIDDDSSTDFNLIDRETGEPTDNIARAANEILYKFNSHPKSIYYGLPDFVPAVGHIMANAEIRDYLLQFFEHNTVPRYAVIVKGAKVSPEVKEHIKNFFSSEVKGNAHKTLFIPIPSVRGEVEIIFEKLDADQKEGSFLEAKKNNDQVIMVAHGTPPAILGIAEAASLGSGKGLSQAEIYKDRIITPRQKIWGKLLEKLFSLGLGTKYVEPTFDPLDVRDRVSEMEILTGYEKAGNLSINEVREWAELGRPVTGGDRSFIMPTGSVYFVDELEDATSQELSQNVQNTVAGGKNKAPGTGGESTPPAKTAKKPGKKAAKKSAKKPPATK